MEKLLHLQRSHHVLKLVLKGEGNLVSYFIIVWGNKSVSIAIYLYVLFKGSVKAMMFYMPVTSL